MADNFKAWSVIDRQGNFVAAIMVAVDFQGLPDIPHQFNRDGNARLVVGIPLCAWMRWVGDHWEARPGQQPEAAEPSEV